MFILLFKGFFDSADDSAVWIAIVSLIVFVVMFKVFDYMAEE